MNRRGVYHSVWLLLALVSSALAAPPPQARSHALAVQILPDTHGIRAVDEIRIAPGDGPFRFALASGLTIESGATVVAKAENHTIWGVDGPFDVERTVRIVYAGTIHDPIEKSTKLSFVVGDGTNGTIESGGVHLRPGTLWYPSSESAPVARFDLTVTMPKPWIAVAQGRLSKRESVEENNVSVWRSTIPTDGLHLDAGPYHMVHREHGTTTIGVYTRKENPKFANAMIDAIVGYLDYYEPLIGKHPHPRFDVVENFFTSGYGMPGYTLLGGDVLAHLERMIGRMGGRLPPGYLDHELVHDWWGNGVFIGEGANWCEGLTTYCANYMRQERDGPDAARAARRKTMQQFAIRVNEKNDYPVREFRGKQEDFENQIGYGKASMIFHMIRERIGDDAFFGALRDVVAERTGQYAGWDTFREAFEKRGKVELKAWLDGWLDSKGGPVYELEARRESRKTVHLGVSLRRGSVAEESVPVELRGFEGERKVVSVARGESRVYTADFAIESAALDPDWRTFRLPAQVPSCLNATLEQRPFVSSFDEAGDRLAESIIESKGGRRMTDSDADASIVSIGSPFVNRTTAVLLERVADRIKVEPKAITIDGKRFEGSDLSLLASFRGFGGSVMTVMFDLDSKAVRRSPRYFFYGWDGYVVFKSGRPIARGQLEPDTVEVRFNPVEPYFRELVGLEGRGTGEGGGERATEFLVAQFLRLGLEPSAKSFTFPVLDWSTPFDVKVTTRDADGKEVSKTYPAAGLPWPSTITGHGRETTMWRGMKKRSHPWPFRTPKGKPDPNVDRPLHVFAGVQSRLTPSKNEFHFTFAPHFPTDLPDDAMLSFEYDARPEEIESANIVGVLPPLRESPAKRIVIGAHYDGMGKVDETVWPSADDNASGVATMLRVAELLKGEEFPFEVVFVAFGAEEWGLRGSHAFEKKWTSLVINLDSIGARAVEPVYVLGGSHHARLAGIATEALKGSGFEIGRDIDKFAYAHGSDHWPFHEAGVPAITLWSSDRKIMNTAEDTPDKVDVNKLERIAQAVAAMVRELGEEK